MLDQLPAEARTVEGIRRLMKQLCEALDALSEGVSLAAPDVVRALLAVRKEIVPIIDERLTKAAELIRQGLRDEAASYASEPPELVQAATLLDISGNTRWKIWLTKLAELNIPTPPTPRMDLVAVLTKAQDELVQLKPLLDAWRRMNLANAPLADRIVMLGKLRKADPENELWFEALQEHQKQRIRRLELDVSNAVKAKDDRHLDALVAEMQQEWIEPVPRRILATAMSALDKFRSSRIDRELDALADSLAAAHEARDIDAARTLRDRWRELGDAKGSFAVDDPRLTAALPAVDWVDAHDRMAAVSEEIWNSLDARPGGLRARQDWMRALERLGNEMENLAEKLPGDADGEAIERAHERIGRQQLHLDRDLRFRRMMMYVGIASTAVVLGLIVWYFDDRARYDVSVATALRELRAAQAKIAAGSPQELPDLEGKWPARIAGHAEVSTLFAIVRGELEQQADRRTRLAAALDKARASLQAAEAAERDNPLSPWPPAFAETSRNLAELDQAKMALTDQEQADVARVKTSLDRLGRKLVGEADGLCRQRIAAFDTELDKARNLLAADGNAAIRILEEVKPAIAALREQAAAPAAADASASHTLLRMASDPVLAVLSPTGALLRKVQSIEELVASRRRFRDAVQDLDRRLGDWRRYTEQLDTIARDFAEFPESRDYALAAENRAQWPAIDAWRDFQPRLRQIQLATPEQATEIVAKFEALPEAAKELPVARRIRQDFMPSVEHFAGRDLERLRTELEKWFSGAWLGELKFVVQTQDKTTYYCLSGPQPGEAKFTYVTGRKDAELGWPTKDLSRIVESVGQSPQARLADVLRGVVRDGDPSGGTAVDDVFVKMLEAVVAAKSADPVPRLVTARKLLLLAAEYSLPWRESGRQLTALLDDGEGAIPGLALDQLWSFVPPSREQDPAYQLTKQKCETLLAEIQKGLAGVKGSLAKLRKLLAAPPDGLAALAGRLGRNDAGDLIAVWQGSAPPQGRVWWFSEGRGVAVAGAVDDKGVFLPGPDVGPAGTPLFTIKSESKGAAIAGQRTEAGGGP
jgi:hypothetical protein